MTANTKIEWADSTFNPWMGCTKVSVASTGGGGCDRCYAEHETPVRVHRGQGRELWGAGAPRVRTSPANWRQPLRWNDRAFYECADCRWRGDRPSTEGGSITAGLPSCPVCDSMDLRAARRRVFCASLADVFDNEVPEQWRADLFDLIGQTPNLDWLLLTKRIGNADRMICDAIARLRLGGWKQMPWPWPHVWLGATVVNQKEVERDVVKLLATRARKRFLSIEPLLGAISFEGLFANPRTANDCTNQLEALDWVIVGGESGNQARPMHPEWVRSLRDQCGAVEVPLFFKQWGEWLPISQSSEGQITALYKSRVKAKEHEDQSVLDDVYGKDCTVQSGVIHADGSLHDLLEPLAFLQGTEPMQVFKVGKKAAGRELDGREWNEVPSC